MNTIKACTQSVLGLPLIIEIELGDLNNPQLNITSAQQAEDIDNLTDRILLDSYNYYPVNLFTRHCKWINLLGHTTKANTIIWPNFSAEAYTGDVSTGPSTNAFNSSQINHWNKNSCNAGSGPWGNYLGDYLMANFPNGLTGAEDQYYSAYDNAVHHPSTSNCQNCSCIWDNGDNAPIDHFMWFTYTLMDDPNSDYHGGNPEYKIRPLAINKNELNYLEITPNPSLSDNLKIKYFLGDNNLTASLDILNLKGQLVYSRNISLPSADFVLNKQLLPGIYFCKLIVDGKETDLQKLVIMP